MGIEHGNLIDKETFKLMAKKGVHYTPTLIVGDVSDSGARTTD
jgi:imidazolonepropionase-like amidohydrolase